jgi:hypothetical protein
MCRRYISMAKVLNPLNSTEARGRMGGIVYNTSRGLNYVKGQTAPAQPRSQKQLSIRAWGSYLVRQWATITATERLHWNNYAASHTETDGMGMTKRLTGLNWYVRCNIRLLQNGFAIKTEPPATAAPDPLANLTAGDGILSSAVLWTATGGTDKTVELFVVGPHSQGRQAKIEMAKRTRVIEGESGGATIYNLTPGRYTVFARSLDEDNGLVSAWVSDTADVTAA